MAELVVGRALLRILQDLVGFVDFLEILLGPGVAGIAIRMELHRLRAEGLLDRPVVRALGDTQCFVIVAFGHGQRRPMI